MTLKNTKSEPAQTEAKCASCGVRRFNHSLQSREHAFVEPAQTARIRELEDELAHSKKRTEQEWRICELVREDLKNAITRAESAEAKITAFTVQTERQKFYAGTEHLTFKRIMCCKCQHVGQKLERRECGHHVCLSCKEPN